MGGSVEALAIDTELFGFQVGRIQSEAQSPEELHDSLEGAKGNWQVHQFTTNMIHFCGTEPFSSCVVYTAGQRPASAASSGC